MRNGFRVISRNFWNSAKKAVFLDFRGFRGKPTAVCILSVCDLECDSSSKAISSVYCDRNLDRLAKTLGKVAYTFVDQQNSGSSDYTMSTYISSAWLYAQLPKAVPIGSFHLEADWRAESGYGVLGRWQQALSPPAKVRWAPPAGFGRSTDRPKVFHYFQHSGWPLLIL